LRGACTISRAAMCDALHTSASPYSPCAPVPQSKIRRSPLAVVSSTQEVLPPKKFVQSFRQLTVHDEIDRRSNRPAVGSCVFVRHRCQLRVDVGRRAMRPPYDGQIPQAKHLAEKLGLPLRPGPASLRRTTLRRAIAACGRAALRRCTTCATGASTKQSCWAAAQRQCGLSGILVTVSSKSGGSGLAGCVLSGSPSGGSR
jgi:hypothetical protein